MLDVAVKFRSAPLQVEDCEVEGRGLLEVRMEGTTGSCRFRKVAASSSCDEKLGEWVIFKVNDYLCESYRVNISGRLTNTVRRRELVKYASARSAYEVFGLFQFCWNWCDVIP